MDGQNGYLVDFFDSAGLAERICTGLRDGADQKRIRGGARGSILRRYNLRTICLPAQLALLQNLVSRVGVTSLTGNVANAQSQNAVGSAMKPGSPVPISNDEEAPWPICLPTAP